MKPRTLLALLAVSTPAFLFAQRPDMQPSARTFVELREGERNPFGQQMTVLQPTDLDTPDSGGEEARLRRLFGAMKVSGSSRAGKARRVLVGGMILREGEIVPSILRDQQESIRVALIDDNRILLAFVERDASVEARQIQIPITLDPSVSQVLFGEAFEKMAAIGPDGRSTLGEAPVMGVEEFIKGSSEAKFENVIDRTFQMMGEVKHEKEPQKEP